MSFKFGIKPKLDPIPDVNILIPIGATLDIPTGEFIKGENGQWYLNGGLGSLTAVVGIGNNFKSTLMHFMTLSGAERIWQAALDSYEATSITTYDTESNKHPTRQKKLTTRFELLNKYDILASGVWLISNKIRYYANEWYEGLKDFLTEKTKSIKDILMVTPFLDKDKKNIKIPMPTFSEIDSFSEFESSDVAKTQEDVELGDSAGNTIHMRLGLVKTRFLMDIPTVAGRAGHFVLMTAHIGKETQMASGPYAPPPPKKLQHLKHGDKIKGVTDKFTFHMSNCWQAYNAAPYINQGTKGPEYPRNPEDNVSGDMDLNIVSIRQLRSKSGPTGITLDILVSQSEGVLSSLTEFHYIKSEDRFGLGGNDRNYYLELYPDCKLQRTTVRNKIDTDPKLCRAINISSEICQMRQYWRQFTHEFLCEPKTLYEDLIKLGYDWDKILSTRGWWTFNNDKHPIPYCSSFDLLMIRAGKLELNFLKK